MSAEGGAAKALRWQALAALSAIALALRWGGLERSLTYDELFTLSHFSGSLGAAMGEQIAANNHPVASLLAWLARALGAESARAMRLPFWLAGGLAAPALAWALWPSGRRRAWLAGGMVALAPPLVLASQQVRGYAPMLLCASLLLGFCLRCLEADRLRLRVAIALTFALALGSHATLALGALAACATWALSLRRRALGVALGLGAGALVALLVWGSVLARTGKFVRANVGVAAAGGLHPGPFDLARWLEAFGGAWVALGLVALVAVALVRRAQTRRAFAEHDAACSVWGTLAWAVAPAALMLVSSLGYARFALFAWPALLACAAEGAATAGADPSSTSAGRASGRAARSALVGMCLTLVLGLMAWRLPAQAREELHDLQGAVQLALARQAEFASEGREAQAAAAGPGAELLALPALGGEPSEVLERLRVLRRPWVLVVPLPAHFSAQPWPPGVELEVLPGREAQALVVVGR